ncbi:hypothetical protein FRC09_010504 [Ceratobasidium sp. 395]|nr:hypothetical protein FRC09_010504 [Ceratobasidium sp. 395]
MANTSPHEFLYSAAMQSLSPQETISKMNAALEHLHQILGYGGFFAIVNPVDADGDGERTAQKQELDSAMRNALGEAAGDPLAEMRWTKQEQLEEYGVRIIGWPPDIGLRNPSNNPVRDNKTLLPLLNSGQFRFVKRDSDSAERGQADPAHSSVPPPKCKPNLKLNNTPPPNSSNHPNLQLHVTLPQALSTHIHTNNALPHTLNNQSHLRLHKSLRATPSDRVSSRQEWTPASSVSTVYGTAFSAPPQMVVERSAGGEGDGTINVSQISTPDGNSAGGGFGADASGLQKRRNNTAGGVGGNGGKKRRGTTVEATSG